uniref:Thaumatin-like protein n=3 Tax=Cucumis TaxID=3655 RepID=A0A0A0KYE6_CUCSA|nr:thaumatin-like protein [Cucumis x hytivus]
MEMDPNFDQSLLPFGSVANTGVGFIKSCGSIPQDSFLTFTVLNNCPYTVWAAANPGGGRRLDTNHTWLLKLPSRTTGRIWGRNNCKFDNSGHGICETGDCGGKLECQTYGSPPNTLAEFSLNQINNLDLFDISLVDGFNIAMEFKPMSKGCSKVVGCTADINGQCPQALKAAGGCNNPCQVFKTDKYCCFADRDNCGPTDYSKFFKDRCPHAYSYPTDDATSTYTCPSTAATGYQVLFCPT